MNRHSPIWPSAGVIIAAAATVWLSGAPLARQQNGPPDLFAGPRERPSVPARGQASSVVPYRKGADVTARISNGIQELTLIQKGASPLRASPPEGMSSWEFLTRNSDAVAIISVNRKAGALTQDRDWVESVISANVVESLKLDKGGLTQTGNDISLYESGGDVQVGRTRITARRSWAVPFQVGTQYLAFLSIGKNGEWQAGPGTAFEVDFDEVRSMELSARDKAAQKLHVRDAVAAARHLSPVK